jgi:hypothetical protein
LYLASGRQVPTFRAEAASQVRAACTPDAARAVSGSSPGLIPESTKHPGFDAVPTLSTLRRRFTLVRLPGSHLTESSVCLFLDAHHHGSLPQQLKVVWSLPPQAGSEGPSFISRAASLPRHHPRFAFVAQSVREPPDGVSPSATTVPVHRALHHYLLARGLAGYLEALPDATLSFHPVALAAVGRDAVCEGHGPPAGLQVGYLDGLPRSSSGSAPGSRSRTLPRTGRPGSRTWGGARAY